MVDTIMATLRIENFRSALNGPTHALLDSVVVYETKKLTKVRAKALFGF